MKSVRKLLRRISGRDAETGLVVLSFPKSGRTWHRVMLGHYLTQIGGLPDEMAMQLDRLTREALIGRVVYTHNGANFTDATHYAAPTVADPAEWTGKPVLLIVRDPRDVLVSAFFHARYREQTFSGEIAEFVRAPETGIDKVLTALNRWDQNRHRAAAFDVVSYEEMHAWPDRVLAKTLQCLGLDPDSEMMRRSIEFASFDRMKAYERGRTLAGKGRKLAPRGHPELGAKVRSGKMGSHKEALSADDLEYICARTAALGDPFASHYRVAPQ